MKPGGSMAHSQGLSSNPYPRTDTYFFKIHSNIVSHLRLGLPKGLFPVDDFKSTPNFLHFGYIICSSHYFRLNHPDY